MADFVAVLKKTIDGLGETTPEIRAKVYQKARATVDAKLAALNPPPPESAAERQRKALEDAIREIEAQYAPKPRPPADDPMAELDALFAELTPAKKQAETADPVKPAPPIQNKAPSQKDEPRPAPERAPVLEPDLEPIPEPELQPHASDLDEPVLDLDDAPAPPPPPPPVRKPLKPVRKRAPVGRWLAAAAILAILAAAGYGLWLNRDSLTALMAGTGTSTAEAPAVAPAATPPATQQPQPQPSAASAEVEADADQASAAAEEPAAAPEPQPQGATAPAETASAEAGKFTQRLNADGSETDPGPATEGDGDAEGTTVAAATTPPEQGEGQAPDAPAAQPPENANAASPTEAPAAAQADPAVPVGQKAIFYEERTSTTDGSADNGSVIWSLVQEPPAADLPPEPAIRAEASVPERNLRLRMTIRRNADQTLPASHIVELLFLTPEGFTSGPIDNVLRMTMKSTEAAAGNPLIGVPAKIADGFFLVALNDGKAELEANTALMRRQSWIDVPIVYRSGRRALITLEKGVPGDRIFDEALRAWQAASSG